MPSETICLSQAAIREIERLRRKQHSPDVRLRVRVRSGGCAQLYYDLGFDDTQQPEDRLCQCNGVEIVIDALSLPYLDGLTIDYTEDLMGGGFRFYNPHAQRTCSCGHSFIPQAETTSTH